MNIQHIVLTNTVAYQHSAQRTYDTLRLTNASQHCMLDNRRFNELGYRTRSHSITGMDATNSATTQWSALFICRQKASEENEVALYWPSKQDRNNERGSNYREDQQVATNAKNNFGPSPGSNRMDEPRHWPPGNVFSVVRGFVRQFSLAFVLYTKRKAKTRTVTR